MWFKKNWMIAELKKENLTNHYDMKVKGTDYPLSSQHRIWNCRLSDASRFEPIRTILKADHIVDSQILGFARRNVRIDSELRVRGTSCDRHWLRGFERIDSIVSVRSLQRVGDVLHQKPWRFDGALPEADRRRRWTVELSVGGERETESWSFVVHSEI